MFIHPEKFKELREKAKNGDEKAIAILKAFRNDDPKMNDMIDDYFKPIVESKVEVKEDIDRNDMSRLDKYLADNNIKEGDEDYDEYVEEFYNMFPKERPGTEVEDEPEEDKEPEINEAAEPEEIESDISLSALADDENEAIEGYDKMILKILNNTNLKEDEKTALVAKMQKIKDEEIDHLNELHEIEKDYGEKIDKIEGMLDEEEEL